MKKRAYELVHEDEQMIVVQKSSGVLTIPDRYKPELPNIRGLLQKHFGEIFVVHRLDFDTSGLICFARNEEAHRHLSLQFEHRSVRKIYHAILDGQIRPEEGTIDQPIAPIAHQPGKMTVHPKGKPSLTTYKILESFKGFSLVEAQIHTGRTHQVRVHFASLGFPLVIDPVYGRREAFYLSEIKGKSYRLGKQKVERPLVSRATLHAAQLELDHPVSGERLSFESPWPKDIKAMINQFRKWASL
jgi:23S rRNA pseudouridine1911/1915/1917 synthase